MFVDYTIKQLNKDGQLICGDNIEVIENEDNTIIVLSDGLGSGIKANISSTFTKIIVSRLLSSGFSLGKIVEVLEKTLPDCKVRNIAYSTFSVIQIYNDMTVNLIEFDNPHIFYYHDQKPASFKSEKVKISDKDISISRFKADKDDYIVLASDGLIHAGRDGLIKSGWGWEKINKFINESITEDEETEVISKKLVDYADILDQGHVKDDISVIVVKIRDEKILNVAIGPPLELNKDLEMVEQFINSPGKKVVCGGTTADIISRALHSKKKAILVKNSSNIPAKMEIKGIDLATEGMITLSKTLDIIESLQLYIREEKNRVNFHNLRNLYSKEDIFQQTLLNVPEYTSYKPENPAEELAVELRKADTINFYVGRTVNPANNFLNNLEKTSLVEALISKLKQFGKKTSIAYF